MPSSKIRSGKSAQVIRQGHTESAFGSDVEAKSVYKKTAAKELKP